MEDKYVKLKSETISGRRVDFYDWMIYNPRYKKHQHQMIVANVEGIKPGVGRKFFSGADTKKELMRRLPSMIDRAVERGKREAQIKTFENQPKRQFYFKVIRSNRARNSSGTNETAEVFKIKNGELIKLGETKWNTASSKGKESEVLDFLVDKKEIPKGMFPRGYFSWSEGERMNVKIKEM